MAGTVVMPQMLGIYQDLLQKNVANYGNVLNSYAEGHDRLSRNLPNVQAAYGQIDKEVQNILGMGQVLGQNGNWGVAAPAARAIRDTLQQTQAQNDQNMISSGLGNSTIRSNMNTQAATNAANAYGDLGAQLAGQAAGAKSQIGLAQQAAQMQGQGLHTQLSQARGSALAGYTFGNTAGGLLGSYSADPVHPVGGFSGTRSAASDQGSPTGRRYSEPAGPGASGYGSDSRLIQQNLGGYGGPGGMIQYGQTINPLADYMGSGYTGGDFYDTLGNNYSSGTTYDGGSFGTGMGAGWEGGTYYEF